MPRPAPTFGLEAHVMPFFPGDKLRQKIERDATRPQIVRTEPGVGYRLMMT